MGYSFRLATRFFYMHHLINSLNHSTTLVTPVVEHWLEWEIAQWVHEGSIRRSIAPKSISVTKCFSLHKAELKGNLRLWLLPRWRGAGCSSVDSVPTFEAVGRRIDPSQWTQLQFGLFSVPTSGPQLVYQRPWYVLFCLWKSAYKRSLAAYRKE